MKAYSLWLGVVMIGYVGLGVSAYASTAGIVPATVKFHAIMLAQASAQCQQEAAQLQAQLAQCTTDECRRQMQAAIAAHNQRCQ